MLVRDELGVGGLIERIKNRQHHKLAVRQGLGRRIYRDTAKWPLYLERTYLSTGTAGRPPSSLTRTDLGGWLHETTSPWAIWDASFWCIASSDVEAMVEVLGV